MRRPLTSNEFWRLVAAAKAGPVVEGATGSERAMWYCVGAYTGFRRRGISELRVCDFDFTQDTVVLPPEADKGKKLTPPTPLRQEIIPALRKAMEGLGPLDRPFAKLTKHASADGIRADVEAAGIPIADTKGRVVDFHALRSTFAVFMKDGGVALVDAQHLMHHSPTPAGG